jgi:hypothetical protein
MRIRSVIILTGIVSSLLGAVVVYLVLTVPNDLQSAALLKDARHDIAAGKNDQAREALSRIVQQYPRTDAAAAATVALIRLSEQDHDKLVADLDTARRSAATQKQQLDALARKVAELAGAPPREVIVQLPAPAPAPAPVPVKKPPAKKSTPKRRSTRRH